MFCLIGHEEPPGINLKCDPIRAEALRQEYEAIKPGYHMSKKHWNTITLDNSISTDFLKELIDHSYDLVLHNLSRKERSLISG